MHTRYDLRMKFLFEMRGRDLAITTKWMGNLRRKRLARHARHVGGMELLTREVSMATSLDIEEVDLQVGGGASQSEYEAAA